MNKKIAANSDWIKAAEAWDALVAAGWVITVTYLPRAEYDLSGIYYDRSDGKPESEIRVCLQWTGRGFYRQNFCTTALTLPEALINAEAISKSR